MTAFERAHYAESDHLACVEYDEPTIFTEATKEGLELFWEKMAHALGDLMDNSESDTGVQSDLVALIWDAAVEIDRRDPDDIQHHLAGGNK